MAQPSRTTVTIDGQAFNAVRTEFMLSTQHDGSGLPLMGSSATAIDVQVDVNDTVNMPFGSLRALFNLADLPTRDKIKTIKIEFWKDDNRTDVICAYNFQGWISRFHLSSSGEANHLLSLSLEPTLGKDQFHKLDISN